MRKILVAEYRKKYRATHAALYLALLLPFSSVLGQAQQTSAGAANAVVPTLVNYSGVLKDASGKAVTGITGVTFLLYKDAEGGAPLWLEAQNVTPDKFGHYTVQLGSTSAAGLPADVFMSGEARWLAVQPQGQEEQPRILLMSVPYAMKALDAETIGGLPASAFMLAAPTNGAATTTTTTAAAASSSTTAPPPASSDVTTTGGTVKTIPLFSAATNIQNSILTQTGTTGVNVVGKLTHPATGAATKTAGTNSQPDLFVASSFNSTTSAAENQTFQWQAEPASNDTTSPSGTLNLLYGLGATAPAETGLKLSSKGLFTFATGQTFPGIGTITGVTAGSDLTGGGTTGKVTLNLDTTKVPLLASANKFTANQTVTGTVTATSFSGSGTGLTGVTAANSAELGGVAANAFPELAAANTFTNGNAINANNSAVPALKISNAGGGDGIDISAQGYGVYVSSADDGIVGVGTGDGGFFTGGKAGIVATNSTDRDGAIAAYAFEFGTSQQDFGVYGFSASTVGIGAYGQAYEKSNTGLANGDYPSGVWGDSGIEDGFGVAGSADDGWAFVGYNNASCCATLYLENLGTGGTIPQVPVFEAVGKNGECSTDVNGNLGCTGAVATVAPVEGGAKKVALNAIHSAENWFEDAGSAQLSAGEAVVNIESVFGETVNTGVEYHVFLTPNGDCKGLYVAQKSPTSFVVRELGGGASSIAFDYRIMAKRMGFETLRLADRTQAFSGANHPKRSTKARNVPSARDVQKQMEQHLKPHTVAQVTTAAPKKK